MIGRVFDRLATVIGHHGGFLEKYVGDAILAVFGVPVAHEDDPERAIRAALEMQAVMAEMNRASTNRLPLEMRIGVEAGDVLVDLERVTGSRDRMLTGDAVNTAARLQSASNIGAVLVGPTAYSLTKNRIDFSEAEILELKGKTLSVHAYTALRPTSKHAGERAALGFESPMVGRDEELTVLEQTLHRVESEGRPALVTILGPAGSGKSRLVTELFGYLDNVDQIFYWRAGRCLPYGAAAYSGLADVIKSQCEVLVDDPAEVVAEKVGRTVQQLGGDAAMLTAIEHLLGLSTEATMGREHLFDMWRRFLERMAARYPVVVVLEDIHWADEGLLDFIDFLADWAVGRIMVLTLARPELLDRRPTWGGGKPNYEAIYLGPLGSAESEQMIAGLLGDEFPVDVARLITRHAEGNPLYTEEIVRMLIERGLLIGSPDEGWLLSAATQDIEVPRSIHALIAARLDALATDEKSLLQDASVVGRIFWSGVAARLADQDDLQTKEQLGRLRIKELITRREPSSLSDEREYGFHHALIRDVAYDSLPKQLRAAKHSIVAQWAETTRSNDREDVVELIATHYEHALTYLNEIGASPDEIKDLAKKALHWSTQAAERSRRMWQTAATLDWYRKAVALAASLASPDEESARLWADYADAASEILPEADAAALYERALERFGDSTSSDAALAKASYGHLLSRMNNPRALVIILEAVATLRASSNRGALAQALAMLGTVYYWLERFKEATPVLTEALELAQTVVDRRTEGEASLTLAGVQYANCDWEVALAQAYHVLDLAREIGDITLLLRASHFVEHISKTYGDRDEIGLTLCREALDIARRHGHRGYHVRLSIGVGEQLRERGVLDEAVRTYQETVKEAPPTAPDEKVFLQFSWAWVDLFRGDQVGARARLDEADSIEESGSDGPNLWHSYLHAEIDHLEGDDGAAETRLTPLLDSPDAVERVTPPELVLLAVRLAVKRGDRETAVRWRRILDHKPTLIDEAFQRWCDGVLSTEPERAADLLADTARRLRNLHLLILEAICLTDLSRIEKQLGRDHISTLDPVIAFLRNAGARRYLEDAEALLS